MHNILSIDRTSVFLMPSLFCFVCTYEIHQTRLLHIAFFISLESSQGGGVHQLGSMTFGLAVKKFLNIESFFHSKLN
jgi:hypothetical protein